MSASAEIFTDKFCEPYLRNFLYLYLVIVVYYNHYLVQKHISIIYYIDVCLFCYVMYLLFKKYKGRSKSFLPLFNIIGSCEDGRGSNWLCLSV